MNNKLHNMLNDFMVEQDVKNEKELNEKLKEFMEKYNNHELKYKNTPLDDAYEILDKAENAKSKKQAIKYAQEAYNHCKDCFDAILFQVHLEENPLKRWKLLEEGLEYEKKRLEKADYFDKENIGRFYGLFETRPYIRGLYSQANYLIIDGKIKQALELCKEIIKLNNSDNTGIRYMMMAIYSYLEDEQSMLKLYKKYPEENLEMLFPLFILYYKLGNNPKAKRYLSRINEINPHLLKFFKGTMKENEKIPSGMYAMGDSSEVIMYLCNYSFLVETVPNINYYILENSKTNK